MLNVFEIWDANERKVPFVVRRSNWSGQFATVIERIECDKMPYGKAFGYPTTNGRPSNHYQSYAKWRVTREVPNAGSYQWELVDMKIPNTTEIAKPELPRSGAEVALNSKLGFGKYRGKRISEVLEENPSYIEWASKNVNDFKLDSEVSSQLQALVSKERK